MNLYRVERPHYYDPITVTITANRIDYKVNYDLNSGSADPGITDSNVYHHSEATASGETVGNIISVPSTVPTKEGYTFEGWTLTGTDNVYQPNAEIDVDDYWANRAVVGDTTDREGVFNLVAKWKENEKVSYTVQYLEMDGTLISNPKDANNGKDIANPLTEEAPVTSTIPYQSKERKIEGYTFHHAVPEKLELSATGEKVLKLYYTRDAGYSYTVNHLWNGSSTPLKTETIQGKSLNENVTASPEAIEGYTPVSNNPVNLTIGAEESENVINIYYLKDVTITASDLTVPYDGKPHGTEAACSSVGLADGHTAYISISGSQTDAGEYKNALVPSITTIVDAEQNDVTSYYKVTSVPGNLTINKRDITFTSGSAEKPYDGTPLTNNSVTITKGSFADGEGATYEAVGSIIDVGYTYNQIKVTPNSNTNLDNYNIYKDEGTLTITEASAPAPATITLSDANGNSLIKKNLTVTAKEAETIKNAYFCVAVTATDDATEAVFTAEPRYATTTMVKNMTRTSDGTAVEGSFVFPEQSVLTFTKEGIYTFTVKEVFDEYIKVNHTTYDDTEYTMTVNVTKDATENKLNAAVRFTENGQTDSTNSITFNNTYKTPVYDFNLNDPDIIKVNKEFKSRYGLSSPTMRFTATATIYKEDGLTVDVVPDLPNNRSAVTAEPTYETTYTKVGEATGTVTLRTGPTDGVFKFSSGKYEYDLKPGKYRITVKETKGNDRYVNYDTETYTYDFTVNDEGEIVDIDTPITCIITNEYTKRHTAATPSKPTLNTGDHYAYVMGYPDGTVRPNGSITRAEVSAILFRLLSDKTRDEYFTTESSFTDVKAGAWYNNSIATLEKAGVIVDTAKGGAFRPNEAITRAELAAMLAQFSDAKPVKGVKFSDVPAEHWAYEAIAIAAKMGWIEGYPDGTFRPDATITRAEMMTLVNRALERVPSDEDHLLSKRVMLTFPDCKSGDWFYIAVQEATNSHTYERAATEKNGDEQWTALRANRDWTLLEK